MVGSGRFSEANPGHRSCSGYSDVARTAAYRMPTMDIMIQLQTALMVATATCPMA